MTQSPKEETRWSALKQRRGRFKVPEALFEDNFEVVRGILQLCVPVRAEMLWAEAAIEYTAIGHVFDEVPKGVMTPWYDVTIDRDGLTVGIKFQRREGD